MQTNDALAQTQQGALQGLRDGGVFAWLGVPYAQPPVGARRFLPPAPAQPWTGVRDAVDYGAACPQKVFGPQSSLGPRLDEDCLTLNIWSPAPDGRKRPVMVWIHGGAFVMGSARMFSGAHLAAQGDIVVVAINYRLGVLGFANFGEALGDDRIESNLGLRDQVEALRWLRDNIAAFGGDPARVTISGESAGSMSVSLLMQAVEARPLFRAAIMQSGALSLIHSHEMSRKVGRAYVEKLGVQTLEELQAVPAARLLETQAEVHKLVPDTIPAAPWFDGSLLPSSLAAARALPTPDIPLLAGYNRHEIRFFEIAKGLADVFLTRASMGRMMREQIGDAATDRILAAYPDDKKGNRDLGSHTSFAMPTLNFAQRHARRHPTWLYRFDCGHPLLGAVHGIELLYLFDKRGVVSALMRGSPLWGKRKELAQRMQKHWINFVREGTPGADWLALDEQGQATLIMNRVSRIVRDPERLQRLAWAGNDVGPGVARV